MHAKLECTSGLVIPLNLSNDPDTLAFASSWVNDNCGKMRDRITVLPSARTEDFTHNDLVKRFLANGNHTTTRSRRANRSGGPVLIYAADDTGLDYGQSLARDNAVIVTEWSTSFTGWGTAVGAVNAATREPFEPLCDGLHEEFATMLFWDTELSGGPARGRGRERVQGPLKRLASAGLDEDFVATYAIAYGASSHLAKSIRAHYQHVTSKPQQHSQRAPRPSAASRNW